MMGMLRSAGLLNLLCLLSSEVWTLATLALLWGYQLWKLPTFDPSIVPRRDFRRRHRQRQPSEVWKQRSTFYSLAFYAACTKGCTNGEDKSILIWNSLSQK